MSVGSGALTILGAIWAASTAGFVRFAKTTEDACLRPVSALAPNDGEVDAAVLLARDH